MTVWFVVVLRVLQSSGCFGRLPIATCRLRQSASCGISMTVMADTAVMTNNRNHSFTSHPSFQTLSLQLNPGHCTGMSMFWAMWPHVNSFTISGFYFSLKWEADLTHVFSDEWVHVQTPDLAPFLFLLCFFISSSHLERVLTERQQKTKGSGSWDHTCCNSGQCVDISTHVHYYISTHVAKCKKLQFL